MPKAQTVTGQEKSRLQERRRPRQAPPVTKCIKCGCTDEWGCDGGCSWVWVDRNTARGMCSSCEGEAA